jgi:hypothetical protein
MSRRRLVIGAAGVLLGLYGVFRLVTEIPNANLTVLALWLLAALVIHDGVVAPAVVAVGWAVAHVVPARARRYLQGGLVVAALVTVVAVPLIYREGGTQPAVKAILRQDYGGNLTLLLGIIAAASLLLYAARVARETRPATAPHDRPNDEDQPQSPPA